MSDWISCAERMPPDLHEVMFFYVIRNNFFLTRHELEKNIKKGDVVKMDIVCGHHVKGIWHVCYLYLSIPLLCDNSIIEVTHWMELPEYPL
jgi:hypothetical protein